MLFYIKYGCSQSHERLVVEAKDARRADEWAEQSAQDCYYSYDCNYLSDEDYELYEEDGLTEEEIGEQEYMDMLNDIEWTVDFDLQGGSWEGQGVAEFADQLVALFNKMRYNKSII